MKVRDIYDTNDLPFEEKDFDVDGDHDCRLQRV